MKRLMLAMVIVLAFSSAAFAISYSDVSVTLSGTNVWENGAVYSSTAQNDNTLKLSTTDAKNNWKANVEFGVSTGVQNKADQTATPAFTLNDVYFQATAQPFTLEVWNWGEDGQGADKKTPMEFVYSNDAPDKNWKTRVTTTLGGNTSALDIKNDKAAPDYFLFTERTIGKNTFGAAYRTMFNHRNILDGWAVADLGVAKVTGEVAKVNSPLYEDGSKYNIGAKAEFPSKITLTGRISNAQVAGNENYTTTYLPIDSAVQQKYFEANVFETMRGSLQTDAKVVDVNLNTAGDKTTIDLRARKSNDQAIGDIWNVDNDFFDINVAGDNDWLKDKGYSAGVNLVQQKGVVVNKGTIDPKDDADATKKFVAGDVHDKTTTTVYAQFAPTEKINVLAKVAKVVVEDVANPQEFGSTTTEIRGYYKVSDKLAVHPRLFVNQYEDATKANTTKLGSYVSYTVAKGSLVGGLWNETAKLGDADAESDQTIEFGYELAF